MKARVPEAEAKGRVLGFTNLIFCLTGESSPQSLAPQPTEPCAVRPGPTQPSSDLQVSSLTRSHEEQQGVTDSWEQSSRLSCSVSPGQGHSPFGENRKAAHVNLSAHFHLYNFRMNTSESTSRKSWERNKSGHGEMTILTKRKYKQVQEQVSR